MRCQINLETFQGHPSSHTWWYNWHAHCRIQTFTNWNWFHTRTAGKRCLPMRYEFQSPNPSNLPKLVHQAKLPTDVIHTCSPSPLQSDEFNFALRSIIWRHHWTVSGWADDWSIGRDHYPTLGLCVSWNFCRLLRPQPILLTVPKQVFPKQDRSCGQDNRGRVCLTKKVRSEFFIQLRFIL